MIEIGVEGRKVIHFVQNEEETALDCKMEDGLVRRKMQVCCVCQRIAEEVFVEVIVD